MEDKELFAILNKATPPPNCDSEKFTAAFLAQMDMDLAANENKKPKRAIAFAAGLAIAIGVGFSMNIMGNGGQNKIQTAQTQSIQSLTPISDEELDALISAKQAENDFASQLVGYEDVTNIASLSDL